MIEVNNINSGFSSCWFDLCRIDMCQFPFSLSTSPLICKNLFLQVWKKKKNCRYTCRYTEKKKGAEIQRTWRGDWDSTWQHPAARSDLTPLLHLYQNIPPCLKAVKLHFKQQTIKSYRFSFYFPKDWMKVKEEICGFRPSADKWPNQKTISIWPNHRTPAFKMDWTARSRGYLNMNYPHKLT